MIFKVLLACNATSYLPEGFLLCVLDYVQYQDDLFQKTVVLLFAGLRGNPYIFDVMREWGWPVPLPLSP